jgi:hypothetical protein
MRPHRRCRGNVKDITVANGFMKEMEDDISCVWPRAILHEPLWTHQYSSSNRSWGRLQLKCDGTPRRRGGEVKGKLAIGVGSQFPSHYLGTWCIRHYLPLMRTPRLPPVDCTDAPADLNGLVRFAERRNLVSARVPSHFKRSLLNCCRTVQLYNLNIFPP